MAKDRRLTQKQISRLLNNPKPVPLGVREQEAESSRRNLMFRASEKNYDALDAEETLKSFTAFLRTVITRYEENQRLLEDAEAREADLSHCMELVEGLTDKEKRMIFRRLTDALQTRRTCKHENEILAPLYQEICDKTLINRLAQLQGATAKAKETISGRSYGCRTDVLDDFRMEEKTEGQ